jgi:nucleotide-binding universal stress UspA family protein
MCITTSIVLELRSSGVQKAMSTGRAATRNRFDGPEVSLQRILVATDFSAGALGALEQALSLAERFQSRVFLVHAIPSGVLRYVAPAGMEDAIRQAKSFAAEEMQRQVNGLGCAELVQQVILCGEEVWPMLQEFAVTLDIDLIVLGTHGRTGSKKRLLGPVAEEIFRLAVRPVLTVGPGTEQLPGEVPQLRRILYATNFKPHAERAAHFAYALERGHRAHLTVLHVVEEPANGPTGGDEIVRDFLLQRMKKGIPPGYAEKSEPAFQVGFGEPGEEILALARKEQADLIVLGVRAGKVGSGHLPSAIAYKIACQSPCPVLTIRH